MRKFLLMAILLGASASVFAGGYRVALQGMRQAAMGAQGATLTRDASVAFFNPAGLAFVDSKFSVTAGVFGISSTSKYQNPVTGEKAETDNPLGTPIYFAANYKPTDNLALAVSVTTPFGNTLSWGNEWSGKYLIDEIELKSFFIQPTIAYKFTDWFSIGGGFIYATGGVNLSRDVSVGNTDSPLKIEDKDASGTGYNLGAFIKPHEKVNIGITYRSKVDMKAKDGDVKFTDVPTYVSGSLPFSAENFDATLPLPSEFTFGVSFQALPKLLLSGEVGANGWEEYRALTLDFYNKDEKTTISSTRDYHNTFDFKFGGEYMAMDNLALRLGYKFDQTPSPSEYFSPETVTIDYHAFTGGFGYQFGDSFYVDGFLEYLKSSERHVDNIETGFKGDFRNNAFIFGLGLTYNLAQ